MKRYGFMCLVALGVSGVLTESSFGAQVYNNLTPNNLIGVASRPFTPTGFQIEAADDFFLGSQTFISSATFVGMIVPGTAGASTISEVITQIYRVFPFDSNTTRSPGVPTRTNSPSDVDHLSRDSIVPSELTFTSSVLAADFTVLNSVQPGGIHPSPFQTTNGNGPLTGQEVQITVTFATPISLAANHYFFVPQVALTNGGQFYWLSASRPISGAGTTPFPPGVTDLQAWTRDDNLDPDWLRVGTDIVGGATPPAFNMAYSLDGTTVPEPGTAFVVLAGLALIGGRQAFAAVCKVVR